MINNEEKRERALAILAEVEVNQRAIAKRLSDLLIVAGESAEAKNANDLYNFASRLIDRMHLLWLQVDGRVKEAKATNARIDRENLDGFKHDL